MRSISVIQSMVIFLVAFMLCVSNVIAHNSSPPPPCSTTTPPPPPPPPSYPPPPPGSSTYSPPPGSPTYPPPSGPPTYPPQSGSPTYPPSSSSPTYPPSSGSSTYPPSSGSTTYPPSSGSSTYPTSSGAPSYPPPPGSSTYSYPTYTPRYPSPTQGLVNNTVNASDPRIITYGTGWQPTNSSCGGSGKRCAQPGLYLNFTFDGTGVYMWTSLAENSGTCSVSLDNSAPVSIDGFVNTTNPVCIIAWSAFGLANGQHSVVVTNLGQSEKASNSGKYNATIYESDGFIITTTTTTSGSMIVTTNSLYLVVTILTALFTTY